MSNTSNLDLERPDKGDDDWHTSLNSNFTKLDTGYGNNVASIADIPEVYIETGTFNSTSGDTITLPKSVDAVNEYNVTITPTSRGGAIGDVYVTKTTSNFVVYCSEVNTIDTFAATIYYIGDINSYGGSIYRRYYVSPDASITDHSDDTDTGSLAWILDQIGASLATIELPGNKTYNITANDLTIGSNIKFINQKGGILNISSGKTVTFDHTSQIQFNFCQQIFSGSGSVVFTNGGTAYAEWWDVDGTADEVEINYALGSGAEEVLLQGKTYTCNDEVTVPKNVNLIGVNPKTTVLDFGSATGTFSNSSCVYAAGDGLTEIGALNTNITKGTNTVAFASTPSVNYGDVIIIHDTDDYSYSGFRTYYQAGEYGVVEEVSGNNIELSVGTFSAYTADANTLVFKYNNPTSSHIKNIKVIGDDNSSNEAISIVYGQNALVENCHIKFEQGQYGLNIQQCFNCRVKNATSEIHSLISGQTSAYPIGIFNSQDITVDNCFAISPWHAITTGGGTGNGKVVNRNIKVVNSTFLSNDTSSSGLAADFHGNTEHSIFENCYCQGIAPSGNFITVSNCDIYMSDKSYAMVIGEPTGLDYVIKNNRFIIDGDPATSRGAMINIGGNENHLTSNTAAGGTFEVVGNNVIYNGTADGSTSLIRIINRGCTQDNMKIFIENNKIKGNYSSTGHKYAVDIDVVSGAAFNNVSISNNYIYGYGIKLEGVLAINIDNNVLTNGGSEGLRLDFGTVVTGTPGIWKITNNIIKEFQTTGIRATGDASQLITHLVVDNNVVTENSIVDTGTAAFNSALYIYRATSAYVRDNVLGGTGAGQDQPAAYYTITTLYDGANIYFGTGSGSEIYSSITSQNEIVYSSV